MTHKMNLTPAAFGAVSTGKKTVEMRLFDEKRSKINIGDRIEFENTDTHQTIMCRVVSLTQYNDFYELYSHCDKVAIGYGEDEIANAEDMYNYYSAEQIKENGVLAIEIELIRTSI